MKEPYRNTFLESLIYNSSSIITDNKAKAVSALSDSIVEKQNELYTTELKNRMNYISLLNGIYTGYNDQIMNYLNMAKANAESANNYNTQTYSKTGNNWSSTIGSVANVASSFFS